jgi:hypothetical protein
MVSNYPHAVASDEQVPATEEPRQSDGRIGNRLLGFVRQTLCGLHGHDTLLQFEQDRMFLKCVSCGHETPGWELNEVPPTISVAGDVRRRALVPAQLISERRIA